MLSRGAEINRIAYLEIDNYRRSVDYGRECYDSELFVLEEFQKRTNVLKRRLVIRENEVDIQKNERLKKTYGISLDIYREMLKNQKGLCSICGERMAKPNIDHDHKTGKVRGLLCRRCNTGLGIFRDSIVFLKSAVDYLK